MTPRKRGYLTQCDSGGGVQHINRSWNPNYVPCPATARLSKPGHWRCPRCTKHYGVLSNAGLPLR